MAESSQRSTRDAVRCGLLLADVAVSGYRLPGTLRNFQQWRVALGGDSSAVDFYKTSFTVNAVGIAIILVVAIAVFYLLRPPATQRS